MLKIFSGFLRSGVIAFREDVRLYREYLPAKTQEGY